MPLIGRKQGAWLLVGGTVFLTTLLLLVGCRAEPLPPPAITPPPTTAVLHIGIATGAVQFGELVTAVYPSAQTSVTFVPGNTEALFADLAANQLDAILVHHIPPGSEDWFNPVALDGLVLVVHPENPVNELSSGEVQAMFNGRLTNWQVVGGTDTPIQLISRERGAGARTLFGERIMGTQRVSILAQIQPDDAGVLTAVAANPAAIGYSLMGTAVGAAVKILTIDDQPATPNTTGTQTYPLTTPLYFVSPAEPTGPLRDLLAWIQSPAGQAVVGEIYGRVR